MDVEHKECLNTSLFLMGRYGLKTSGGRAKMEMGRIRRRVHQTAALDALGKQKPFGKGGGHQKSTLEGDCGSGGHCHSDFPWASGIAGCLGCCKLLGI